MNGGKNGGDMVGVNVVVRVRLIVGGVRIVKSEREGFRCVVKGK